MKKFFLVATILLSLSGMAFGVLDIDLTGASIQVKDSTSIHVSGITVIGKPGKYWAELKWDPNQLILAPIAYGQEVAISVIGTWAVEIDDFCDNTINSSSYWKFNSDGSLSSSTGQTATWTLDNNLLTIFFDNATSYTAILNSREAINGTFVSPNSGCWSATRSPVVIEKTWNFWVFDDSSSYNVILKSDANHTFTISFSPGTGNPFVCLTGDYRFMQGNNTFDLSTFEADTDTALITFSGGWNGCDYIYQGQTVSGTISNIPSWLNFNSQFFIGINSGIIALETDGQAAPPIDMAVHQEYSVTLASHAMQYFKFTTPAGGCSTSLNKWLKITMINVSLTGGDGQLLVKSTNGGASSAWPTLADYKYEFEANGYGIGQDWIRAGNGGAFFWNWSQGQAAEILAILPYYEGHAFNQDDTYYLLLYNQGTASNQYRVLWQCY